MTGLPQRYVVIPAHAGRVRLHDLCEERENLTGNLIRLKEFMASPSFETVTERERELLSLQRTRMEELVEILSERITIGEKIW